MVVASSVCCAVPIFYKLSLGTVMGAAAAAYLRVGVPNADTTPIAELDHPVDQNDHGDRPLRSSRHGPTPISSTPPNANAKDTTGAEKKQPAI
jgi:hypothetical protein